MVASENKFHNTTYNDRFIMTIKNQYGRLTIFKSLRGSFHRNVKNFI